MTTDLLQLKPLQTFKHLIVIAQVDDLYGDLGEKLSSLARYGIRRCGVR